VYVHLPFCASRCTYCDFPTVAGQDNRIEAYLAALEVEIATFQRELPPRAGSVFLGGGTPSHLAAEHVGRVLRAVRRRFAVEPDAEITVECNPESTDAGKLAAYRDLGVTRVSIGVQSLDDRVLSLARRAHDGAGALRAVELARGVGGVEVNADLIAGLPGERLESYTDTVETVAALGVDHLSLYLLETDKDTPLSRALAAGRAAVADGEALARVYERSVAVLQAAGLEQYEISNFARAGRFSRHNLRYWSDVPYAGFGLGAHAYLGGRRRANRTDLAGYLAALARTEDPLEHEDPWDPARRAEEALWLALRRVRGADLAEIGARYEIDLAARFESELRRAHDDGLIERDGDVVRLTPFGRLHSNALFADLSTAGAG
jgi:oxygen-independent coproporphyrinogen-3 oxidase